MIMVHLWNKSRLDRLFVEYQVHMWSSAVVCYSGNSLSYEWDLKVFYSGMPVVLLSQMGVLK